PHRPDQEPAERAWEARRIGSPKAAIFRSGIRTRALAYAVIRFFDNSTSTFRYVALDGSSTEQPLPRLPAVTGTFACQFSPDGRQLVYVQSLSRRPLARLHPRRRRVVVLDAHAQPRRSALTISPLASTVPPTANSTADARHS